MSDARGFRGRSSRIGRMLQRAAFDDEGAAYTISYLMVVPLYLVTVYAIVETCLVFNARLGVTYAAYAAARAAVVRPGEASSSSVIERAGVLAFVPFAHSVADKGTTGSGGDEDRLLRLHSVAAGQAGLNVGGQRRLRRQYRYASIAIHVSADLDRQGQPWEEDVEVAVRYEYPFTFPIIGRLLGSRTPDGRYVRMIEGRATLPMENPSNERNSLGIRRNGL